METNVAYATNVIGTKPHAADETRGALYGGLWVGKSEDRDVSTRSRPLRRYGEYCSRLCAIENFPATRNSPSARAAYGGKNAAEPMRCVLTTILGCVLALVPRPRKKC